ncbi:MAG: S-methyl-5-thioribose-1-phosphate isomerase [Chthoniobacterales bacterium]
MNVNGQPFRSIWFDDDGETVKVIDQTKLPHRFEVLTWRHLIDAAQGIRSMVVRGAPLIGAAAAHGVALAMKDDPSDEALAFAHEQLLKSRPTAVNLRWALEAIRHRLGPLAVFERASAARREAALLADQDVQNCSAIGDHGLDLIAQMWAKSERRSPLNILTHCNAGWLATVDWGTALAPIYKAYNAGIPLHVWVDETRPRNQGASLTAWELGQHGVPFTVIADNCGGHLMQRGLVDLCIVGSDRTTGRGDVCNKIGTYLKALAAHEHQVPFYVALPSSTIDWRIQDGVKEIPIEQRDPEEVTRLSGRTTTGEIATILLTPDGSQAANYAFDVTPARFVTALITERGVCSASEDGLAKLFDKRIDANLRPDKGPIHGRIDD